MHEAAAWFLCEATLHNFGMAMELGRGAWGLRKADVLSLFRKGRKEDPGSYSQSSCPLYPSRVEHLKRLSWTFLFILVFVFLKCTKVHFWRNFFYRKECSKSGFYIQALETKSSLIFRPLALVVVLWRYCEQLEIQFSEKSSIPLQIQDNLRLKIFG